MRSMEDDMEAIPVKRDKCIQRRDDFKPVESSLRVPGECNNENFSG